MDQAEQADRAVQGGDGFPVVPGYTLERLLGRGGMGHVYLGRSASGRQVAVKVIKQDVAEDPAFRSRFRQEIAAARQVSGAFTAPVLDADPDAEPPWMVTQFISGPPLDDRIRTGPALTERELRRLAAGLAEALRDIHRADIVHRDLKPSNVMLAEDGPRVIDFGIVRAAEPQVRTQTGIVVGTPPFMSPEQIRASRDLGPSSDVFSFGSVMVYAATGHAPFPGHDLYAVAYQLVHDEPDLAGVPGWLLPVVSRCLQKNPSDRPTAADLVALLGRPADRPPTVSAAVGGNGGASVSPQGRPDGRTEGPEGGPGARDEPGSTADTADSAGAAGSADTGSQDTRGGPHDAGRPDGGSGTSGGAHASRFPLPSVHRVGVRPSRFSRRRRVLASAAAVAATAALIGSALYTVLPRGGEPDRERRPTGGNAPSSSESPATAVAQPRGAGAYAPTQSGSAAFTFAYTDSPDRRPKGWKAWESATSGSLGMGSACVYARESLLCVGEATVRIEAATGRNMWKKNSVGSYGQNTPAVVGDLVIVNTGDAVHALSLADGRKRWSHRTQILTQRLTVDGGNVYMAEHGGRVHALDAATGEKRWTARPGKVNTTGHVPAVRALDGRVYVYSGVVSEDATTFREDLVTVFDADSGDQLAEYHVKEGCVLGTAAIVKEAEKTVMYCVVTSTDESRTGVLRRQLAEDGAGEETGSTTWVSGQWGGGQVGAPELSVSPGRVYLLANGNDSSATLVAVDPVKRTEVWRRPVPGAGEVDTPPIHAGGRLYVAYPGGAAAFDPDSGEHLWYREVPTASTDFPVSAEPLIAGGVVFLASAERGWLSVDATKP